MRAMLIKWNGQTIDGREAAEAAGIPWRIVYQRLKRGVSVSHALGQTYAPRAHGKTVSERIAFHRARAAWHSAQVEELRLRMVEHL